jgi:hypothetical protein
MVVQLVSASTTYLQRLHTGAWLRMALVFTILTGGLLVAFFGITVRVQAATSTRITPAAPPPFSGAHERSRAAVSQNEACGRTL